MLNKSKKKAYIPPTIETESFQVEGGFADTITEEWQNSFTVNSSETDGKVNLLLWTNQTRTTPTNANEQFEAGFSNDDFWGTP